jgi:hypothetical protein
MTLSDQKASPEKRKAYRQSLSRTIVPRYQVDEKYGLQAAQKELRAEAREESASGGVLSEYVVAR